LVRFVSYSLVRDLSLRGTETFGRGELRHKNFGTYFEKFHLLRPNIPMELGAEVNIRCRSPQFDAEVTRAEHRLPHLNIKIIAFCNTKLIRHQVSILSFTQPSFFRFESSTIQYPMGNNFQNKFKAFYYPCR